MADGTVPAGAGFAGLNLDVAPHLLPPSQSPDCANMFFLNGRGRIGPRLGKRKMATTGYDAGVVSLFAAELAGMGRALFIGKDDGSITVENAFYTGGPSWVPVGNGAAGGFFTSVDLAGATGSPATENGAGTLNVSVNGATTAIVTPCSAEFVFEGAIYVYLEFDNVMDVNPAMIVVVEPGGCCGGLTVTCQSVPVNCTGKSKLTGWKCQGEEMGETAVISGTIKIMGVKV